MSDSDDSSFSDTASEVSDVSDMSDIIEPQKYYRSGGYHPVSIGSKMHKQRYLIKKRLGWGYFSTVWLAQDTTNNDYVAIKICKSDESYYDAAEDEISILKKIQSTIAEDSHIITMRDHFIVRGENGSHIAIVFDIMFKDLLYLVTEIEQMPLYFLKRVAYQVLQSVAQLHRSGVIHTDIKPENFLLGLPTDLNPDFIEEDSIYQKKLEVYQRLKQSISTLKTKRSLNKNQKRSLKKKQAKFEKMVHPRNFKPDRDKTIRFDNPFVIKISDLGNACWIHKHFTDNVTTTQYRSPEVLLQGQYSTPIDIFSCGIMFYEMATGELLFDPDSDYPECSCEEMHLAMMMRVLGKIPKYMIENSHDGRKFFNRKGNMKNVDIDMEKSSILKELCRFDLKESSEDLAIFADFLKCLLHVDPKQRISAEDALHHPFFSNLDHQTIHTFPEDILNEYINSN